ncbi:hypothetical protein ACFWPU_42725 [Streptomyces sp. NPDC058471]|uniref:hypothetical protein n=1 Tax=Streptomyces sp. NPDC058471 TaxID=3346516 RepID=UPI00366839B8
MLSDVVPQGLGAGAGFGIVGEVAISHVAWVLTASAVAVALLCWVAAAVWWRRRTAQALAGRRRFTMVPAASFDPQLADIRQAAARLSQARAAAGSIPQRAAATRIWVTAGADGQLEYGWEGPERAASVLRLASYRQVEVLAVGAARDRSSQVRFEGVAPLAERGGW